MPLNSLKDVYIDQLQDTYSACKQARSATRKLAEAATNTDLTDALERGVAGIERGMEALTQLTRGHNSATDGRHCKGMEGMVKEAHDHVLEEDFADDDARDAMIITQYQRMAHYAIAGYGCCKAFADRLELAEEGKTLADCLDRSYGGDREMTKLATGGINRAAA